MNKILYEISVIGKPKSFSTHMIDIVQSVVILILIIYTIKRERSKKEEYSQDNGKYFLDMVKNVFSLYSCVYLDGDQFLRCHWNDSRISRDCSRI